MITCEMWPEPRGAVLMEQKLSNMQFLSVDCECDPCMFVSVFYRNSLIFRHMFIHFLAELDERFDITTSAKKVVFLLSAWKWAYRKTTCNNFNGGRL